MFWVSVYVRGVLSTRTIQTPGVSAFMKVLGIVMLTKPVVSVGPVTVKLISGVLNWIGETLELLAVTRT